MISENVMIALVGASGLVGGTALSQVFGRGLRKAQTDAIRQDIYQQLTTDLKAELDRVSAKLTQAEQRLTATSAEEAQLRRRIAELESRVTQLAANEATLSAELRATQKERDQLLISLAGKDATITALTAQISDLRVQAATLQAASVHSAG